jgi:hypothetical protein
MQLRHLVLVMTLYGALHASQQDNDINTLIDEIVNAPQQERYEKMNAFKQKMREMNQEQRTEALKALQKRMDIEKSVHTSHGKEMPAADTSNKVRTTLQMQQVQQVQQQQMQVIQQQQQQAKQKAK